MFAVNDKSNIPLIAVSGTGTKTTVVEIFFFQKQWVLGRGSKESFLEGQTENSYVLLYSFPSNFFPLGALENISSPSYVKKFGGCIYLRRVFDYFLFCGWE